MRIELDQFHNKLRTKQFFERENEKSKKDETNCHHQKNNTNKSTPHQPAGGTRTPYGNVPFSNIQTIIKLKAKSNWKAPLGSPALETFVNMNEINLNKIKDKKIENQNLTISERKSLKDLSKDKNIVTKPADKGGAIVVLNTVDYIKEAHRQLTDTKTYLKLDNDPTSQFSDNVNKVIDDMVTNHEITPQIGKILKVQKPRTPQIYFLPKIHKQQTPPPGRPIVSANGCPTENISAFVDHFLNPMVPNSPHHVKDTTDFLNKIKNMNPPHGELIIGTMDVTSLYANIPNEEGIQSVKQILSEQRRINQNPKNDSLVHLLRMVLEKNNFQFNGTNYLQIGGTAMGTRVAPSYANLFMCKIEKGLLENYPLKPKTWLRYIDDIFFIWEHGETELKNWATYLNESHDRIKFTMEYSKEKVNFLDVTVKVETDNKLSTDLYTKQTDSHSYLRYDSAHPPHCKKGLPYSQFLRIRRICTNEKDYDKHANEMKNQFKNRGYPTKTLNTQITKCKNLDRESLLQPKTHKDQNAHESETEKIYMTQTFRPCKNSLTETVKNNWQILGRSKSTKNIFRSTLITSFKRPKNIRDHLIRARIDFHPDNEEIQIRENMKTINDCNKPNCKYCKIISTSGKITSKGTGQTYSAKHNITCNSSNIIYCIECKQCQTQYVGQTKRKIKERIREHMYHIKKKIYNSDVAYHFNTATHCGTNDLKIHIVDFIYDHPESKRAKSLRNMIEFGWICKLRTQAPVGLNTLDNRYG